VSGKEIIGALSVVICLYSYGLYMWQIHKRLIKPHLFTWVIWGTLMLIGFAAQYADHAGPGSWNMGVSALITFIIAGQSYFCGEKEITRSDWAALIVAFSAIPVWRMMHDPLWAVIIVSAIDVVAFYPTFRKSWYRPGEEGAFSFFMAAIQFMLSVFALENFTLTTALYPIVITLMNLLLVGMLLYRRRVLR
jgi:hypothetical protein